MKTALKALISVSVVAVAAAIVMAQAPSYEAPKPVIGSDTVSFKATLGSFKLLGSGEAPVNGSLNVAFRGTILLTEPNGSVRFEGDVRKEYTNDAHKKTAYFGKGRLIFDGKVKSIQFFGGDIDGTFKGWCMLRLNGEFDQNYDTGTYQFKGGPAVPWGTGGTGVAVPQQIYNQAPSVKPRVQDTP